MKKKKISGEILRTAITIQIMGLIILACIITSLLYSSKRQVISNCESIVFKLHDGSYDYDNSYDLLKSTLNSLEVTEELEGYTDNVAARVIVSDPETEDSIWLDGHISVLFYKTEDHSGFIDLKTVFGEAELDKLKSIEASSLPRQVRKIYGKVGDKPEIKALEFGTAFDNVMVGSPDEDQLIYSVSENEGKPIRSANLYDLPQSERLNKLLEDPEAETMDNVYTNSVMYGKALFSVGSHYHRLYDGFSNLGFTIAFDMDRIAWKLSFRQVVLAIVYIEFLTLMAVIVMISIKRHESETKALKDNLINALAHELKTPVSVIRNTSEYLATGMRPEKHDHYLGVLTRESASINDIVTRLLTYTRVMDSDNELILSETDINTLIDEILPSFEDRIRDRNLRVDINKGNTTIVQCDRALIKTVIDNMISNAVKYCTEGGAIVIRTSSTRFEISNTAPAFENADLDKIWKPWYQTTLKSRDSETGGMGLSITAGILERHKASYGVKNTDDGVEFSFDLKPTVKGNSGKKMIAAIIFTVLLSMIASFFNAISYARGEDPMLISTICMLLLALSSLSSLIYQPAAKNKKK